VTLVAIGQVLLLGDRPLWQALVPWLGGLALLVVLQAADEPVLAHTSPAPWPARARPLADAGPAALVAVAGLASAVAALRLLDRPDQADHTDITRLWALAMAALVAAAVWRSRPARPSAPADDPVPAPRRRWDPREVWALGGVLVIALAARTVLLDRYPSIIDSDGMFTALEAVEVRLGQLSNPFATGFLGGPLGFPYAQRASMAVFGETLAGSIALNALLGTATVLFTYLLARRWWGPAPALAAAALLATVHGHVYFSRTALNVLADGCFLVVVLWLLDLAVAERKQWAAALAGITVGLAQHFYVSARILVPVLLVAGAALLRWRARAAQEPSPGSALGTAAWVVAGFAVAYLPLGVSYAEHPGTFSVRIEQVSIFNGWIDEEAARTGSSPEAVAAQQVRGAVLYAFETEPSAKAGFHPAAPIIGWPMTVPVAVGLAVATCRPWRQRRAGLVVAWWGVLAGIGLTIDMVPPRWTIAWPMVALLAGLGLATVGRVLVRQVGLPRSAVAAAGALVVAGLMASNLAAFFDPSNELEEHGDANSLVATELADRLAQEPPGAVVYMVTAPRMSYRSHATLRFLAPQVAGGDVLEPMRSPAAVPATRGPTTFVFLPERIDELAVVRAVHPGGETTAVVDRTGEPLFTTYRVVGG
jgi:hypothetical protein